MRVLVVRVEYIYFVIIDLLLSMFVLVKWVFDNFVTFSIF